MANDREHYDPASTLRHFLTRGETGRLVVRNPQTGTDYSVYFMQGDILAAHCPAEGATLARILVNLGVMSQVDGRELAAEIERRGQYEEILLRRIPDDLLVDLLGRRFRQALLDFISQHGDVRFERLDSVFVENIQVGHDSQVLLDDLSDLRARIRGLRRHPGEVTLRPGPSMPGNSRERGLAQLCEPASALVDVVRWSPFEEGETLDILRGMLDLGVIVSDERIRYESGDISLIPVPDDPPSRTPGWESEAVAAVVSGEPDEFELDTADFDGYELGFDGSFDHLSAAPVPVPAVDDAVPAPDEPLPQKPPAGPPTDRPVFAVPSFDTDSVAQMSVPEVDIEDPAMDLVTIDGDSLEEILVEPEPVVESELGGWLDEAQVSHQTASHPDLTDRGQVQTAIRHARDAEERRQSARERAHRDDDGGIVTRPSGFDPMDDTRRRLRSADLVMFQDYEDDRDTKDGSFTLADGLLDVVDLSDEAVASQIDRLQASLHDSPPDSIAADDDEIIEALGAEDVTIGPADKVVALSFSAPRLDDDAIHRRIEVSSAVLRQVSGAIDRHVGVGNGPACIQLLLDGAPTVYAVLFRGVKADSTGAFDVARVVRNLKKRPAAEHRRLLNMGLMDLIERSLSYSVEELPEHAVDELLLAIAGYQQGLRS